MSFYDQHIPVHQRILKLIYGREVHPHWTHVLFSIVLILHTIFTVSMNAILIVRTIIMCPHDYDVYLYGIIVSYFAICAMVLGIDAVVQETTSTLTNFMILSLAILVRQIFAVGFNIFIFLPFGKMYGPHNCVAHVGYFKWEWSIVLIVSLIANIFYIVIWCPMRFKFGKVIVEFVGVDPVLIRKYKIYQIFINLVIFDFLFTLAFTFFYFWTGSFGATVYPKGTILGAWDYALITIFGIGISALFPFGILFVKCQWKIPLIVWNILNFILPIIFLVQIIEMFAIPERLALIPTSKKIYQIIFMAISVFIRIFLIIFTFILICYGNGLKEVFYPPSYDSEYVGVNQNDDDEGNFD